MQLNNCISYDVLLPITFHLVYLSLPCFDNLSVCLSVCLSLSLIFHLSIYLYLILSLSRSISLSTLSLSVSLSVSQFLSISLSLSLSSYFTISLNGLYESCCARLGGSRTPICAYVDLIPTPSL